MAAAQPDSATSSSSPVFSTPESENVTSATGISCLEYKARISSITSIPCGTIQERCESPSKTRRPSMMTRRQGSDGNAKRTSTTLAKAVHRPSRCGQAAVVM
eukprot:scaffold434_cov186-Pinguiococcus_pyrenoidosus.AAC.120